jgi:hypothetical protein
LSSLIDKLTAIYEISIVFSIIFSFLGAEGAAHARHVRAEQRIGTISATSVGAPSRARLSSVPDQSMI